MKRTRSQLAAVTAFVLTAAGGLVAAQQHSDEVDRIQESITVLQELTSTPDAAIPEHILERAEAVVVIPSLVKGGFIVGAKHGKGVLSVRDRDADRWSPPAFVNMTGGSIGWQIGVEAVDLVLLVMNEDAVDELLEDRFTLGGDASIAAGPVGRSANAATNAQMSAKILAYSRARGLFAGATFEGAALHADDDANRAFYGESLDVRTIVLEEADGRDLPAVVATLRQTLAEVSAPTSNH